VQAKSDKARLRLHPTRRRSFSSEYFYFEYPLAGIRFELASDLSEPH
jgi:hypothetical protein